MKLFTLVLFSVFIFQDNPPPQEKSDFIGDWIWVKSKLSSQAGFFITTPETEGGTASIVISADYSLKYIVNDSVLCEREFSIKENIEGLDKPYSFMNYNCGVGAIKVSGDTLKTYVDMGCPSMESFYVRNKN